MFKWMRRVVQAVGRAFVREDRPARPPRRRTPGGGTGGSARTRPPTRTLPVPVEDDAPEDYVPDPEMAVTPSDEWLDSDNEWGIIHPDLIGEVLDNLLADMEAGGYL